MFSRCLDKDNVNFKVSGTCFSVDKNHGESRGSSVMKSEEQNHAKSFNRCLFDPFLMLEVFAHDTNRTNVKLHKVSIF